MSNWFLKYVRSFAYQKQVYLSTKSLGLVKKVVPAELSSGLDAVSSSWVATSPYYPPYNTSVKYRSKGFTINSLSTFGNALRSSRFIKVILIEMKYSFWDSWLWKFLRVGSCKYGKIRATCCFNASQKPNPFFLTVT